MSALYGTLQGCRGEATRCGTKNSGIRVSAQSWNGSLIVNMDLNEEGNPVVDIDTSDMSTSCWGNRQFRGSLKEFEEMCKLYNQIKSGEVSVVKHRKKRG